MTTDYGGPPPTPDADAAGLWAGRTSTDTETPGPCRLVPGEHPDRVLIAASVAASGWPVLALWPGTKKPTHRGSETPNHGDHWLTSPAAVALSADEHDDREPPPGALRGCPSYAVMTGQPSRTLGGLALVALDLDGDPDALAALLAEAGPDAEGWAAETLRVQRTTDRMHLWGTVPGDECPPTGDLTPGLEWRGSTGYAALPGSRHKSGALYEVTGGRYEFTDGGQPGGALYVGMTDPDNADPLGLAVWVHPLPVPASLLAVIRERLGAAGERYGVGLSTAEAREFYAVRSTATAQTSTGAASAEDRRERASGSTARRLEALVRAVPDAPAGQGNTCLNWAAGKAAALCATDPDAPAADDVRAALVAAYLARPIPPGESARSREAEARRTVASGWRWGSTHPAEALAEHHDRHRDGETTDDENGGGAVLHAVDEAGDGDEVATVAGDSRESSRRRRLVLTAASTIKPRRVRWLWEGRLALGSLGLLAGREGLGKSSCAYWLAGQVTRGLLPGEHHGEPRAVLVCATEDSWAHTIVPRLMATGADLTRVYRVEVETSEGLPGALSLPADLPGVADAARETGAALMLLDPLTSRLTEALDTHKDAEVRRALEPLVTAADRADMAVLGLMHHNKSGSTDPLSLVMGSRAFTAVARSVHTVVPDPDDEAVRLFGTPKNNLGRTDLPTLSFRVESAEVPTDEGPAHVGRVVWGESITASIGDVMRRSAAIAARGGAPTATDDAAEWLLDYLTAHGAGEPDLGPGRWVESARVKEAAADAGHGDRPLRNARNRLGVVSESVGFPRRTWWGLLPKGSRDLSRDVSRGEVTTDMTGRKCAGQDSRDSRDLRGGTGTTGVTTESGSTPTRVTDRYGRSVEVSEG